MTYSEVKMSLKEGEGCICSKIGEGSIDNYTILQTFQKRDDYDYSSNGADLWRESFNESEGYIVFVF